jgi:hypothetical protein
MPSNQRSRKQIDEKDGPSSAPAKARNQQNEKHSDGEPSGASDYSSHTFEQHAQALRSGFDSPGGSVQRAAFVQQLQRAYGNAYVQRLAEHVSSAQPPAIQTKLVVGAAGDQYEQEADRVAKEVVGNIATQPAQRDGAEEEEVALLRIQRDGEELDEEEMAQTLRRKTDTATEAATLQRVTAMIQRWKDSKHFQERMDERGITDDEVDDALDSGTMYRDEDTGATIYYLNSVAIVTQGDTLVTCYVGKVKNRWTEI